ncbi:hypothetical protein KSZ_22350 [Dictyobacter formicarum]|uniref:Uncharacterized protein n=1 Tax=Dictyobacter formicarum TaxID=2778368 RepID=A0ABQ3VER7_9CHLR|nr:hypothetical protein KSZ_22350 [Dictyobacter formicarum]
MHVVPVDIAEEDTADDPQEIWARQCLRADERDDPDRCEPQTLAYVCRRKLPGERPAISFYTKVSNEKVVHGG